jgi:hypothetical protein
VTSPNDQVRADLYALRGEIVSVGSRIEWIIDSLARGFANATHNDASRQWDDVKAEVVGRNLNAGLQPQLADIAQYFKPRALAAHSTTVITSVAEGTPDGTTQWGHQQILRLFRDATGPRAEQVTIDDLRGELSIVKEAHQAIRVVGRALDDDDPTVLANVSHLAKSLVLDRP